MQCIMGVLFLLQNTKAQARNRQNLRHRPMRLRVQLLLNALEVAHGVVRVHELPVAVLQPHKCVGQVCPASGQMWGLLQGKAEGM